MHVFQLFNSLNAGFLKRRALIMPQEATQGSSESAIPSGVIFCLRAPGESALEAADITGAFATPDSADRALVLRDALDTYARLQHDITALRAQAIKEKQLSRLVDLNMEVKRLETELATVTERL